MSRTTLARSDVHGAGGCSSFQRTWSVVLDEMAALDPRERVVRRTSSAAVPFAYHTATRTSESSGGSGDRPACGWWIDSAERPWKGIRHLVLVEAGVHCDAAGSFMCPIETWTALFTGSICSLQSGRTWWTPGDGLVPLGLELLPGPDPARRSALIISEGDSDALAIREAFAATTCCEPDGWLLRARSSRSGYLAVGVAALRRAVRPRLRDRRRRPGGSTDDRPGLPGCSVGPSRHPPDRIRRTIPPARRWAESPRPTSRPR